VQSFRPMQGIRCLTHLLGGPLRQKFMVLPSGQSFCDFPKLAVSCLPRPPLLPPPQPAH
jgi:hypothetical protein